MIVEDLKKCARRGVQGFDPKGRPVRIFIDTVALFGDFPQAAAFTDVLGHSANAMCTICSIRRRKGQNVPETNFSFELHSARPGLIRFDARRNAIRSYKPHSSVLRALGMEFDNTVNTDLLPAVRLSNIMREAQLDDPCTTEDGGTVVPFSFDHSQSLTALPDHLMSTMICNVMHVCFNKLQTN